MCNANDPLVVVDAKRIQKRKRTSNIVTIDSAINPRTTLRTAILFILLCSITPSSRAQDAAVPAHHGYRASINLKSDLYNVVFRTPYGAITLDLPADLKAGDRISGAIITDPKGRTPEVREANRAILTSYSLSIGDQSASTKDTMSNWQVPAGWDSQANEILLKDAQGNEVARAILTLPTDDIVQDPKKQNDRNGTDRIRIPRAGQAGQPLTLRGAVGEDLAALHVLIGGEDTSLLAASPRSVIVMTPKNHFGKTKLQVKQGDMVLAEGDYRNNKVSRSFNPWPYIIGAVVIVGAAVAYIAISVANIHPTFGPFPSFE